MRFLQTFMDIFSQELAFALETINLCEKTRKKLQIFSAKNKKCNFWVKNYTFCVKFGAKFTFLFLSL